jgi:superfamily II DNA/RNA helicase
MNQICDIRRCSNYRITPGRLMDLMKRREVNLIRNSWYLMRQMKMLNMGFKRLLTLSFLRVMAVVRSYSQPWLRKIQRIVDNYMVQIQKRSVSIEKIL